MSPTLVPIGLGFGFRTALGLGLGLRGLDLGLGLDNYILHKVVTVDSSDLDKIDILLF